MTANLFTFYSLEIPTEDEENSNERLVKSRSKKIFVGVKKLCCICKEYLTVMLTIVEASHDVRRRSKAQTALQSECIF